MRLPALRGRLFRKYVAIIVALVAGALVVSSAVQGVQLFLDGQAALATLQHEKAADTALSVEQFIEQLQRDLSSAARPQSQSSDQRRDDFSRLMSVEPAIID